jgi:hypothetical protein
MRQFVLMICAVLVLGQLFGQTTVKSKPKRSDYIGLSVLFNDHNDLNRQLRNNNYSELENNSVNFTWGFRMPTGHKGWINEVAIDGGFTPEITSNSTRRVTMRELGFMVRTSYDLLYKKRLTKLYPILGLGVKGQTIRLYDGYDPDINQLLRNDLNIIRFTTAPLRFEAALGFEQGFTLGDTDILLGIRGGINYTYYYDAWSLDGQLASNLNTPGAWAPFVTLTYRTVDLED